MVALAFSTQGVNPDWGNQGGELWSDGSWNKVVITDATPRENSNKETGGHLGLTIKSIEGPDAGKEGYIAVNVYHSKPDVRDRAASQMAALLWCMGMSSMTDTNELLNKPFWVENKHRVRKVDGVDRPGNNFTGVRNIQGIEPGATGGAPMNAGHGAPQMPPPPAGGPSAPQAPGGWSQSPTPAPAPQGSGWAPPAAPAAPSPGLPSAPAAPPAGPQGWGNPPPPSGPAPQGGGWAPQGQPVPQAPQAPQAAPPPAAGGWAPQGAPSQSPSAAPAAPGGWGQQR